MAKSEAEIREEIEKSKRLAERDTHKRQLLYAQNEIDILYQEKKADAIKAFCSIVQKYTISEEDIDTLLESIPFI
jgi:hypothetical protein